MGDGGVAIGASQYAYFKYNHSKKRKPIKSFFLGGKPNLLTIENKISNYNFKFQKYNNHSNQINKIVKQIVQVSHPFLHGIKVFQSLGLIKPVCFCI